MYLIENIKYYEVPPVREGEIAMPICYKFIRCAGPCG